MDRPTFHPMIQNFRGGELTFLRRTQADGGRDTGKKAGKRIQPAPRSVSEPTNPHLQGKRELFILHREHPWGGEKKKKKNGVTGREEISVENTLNHMRHKDRLKNPSYTRTNSGDAKKRP